MQRRTLLQSLGLVTTHALFPSILSGFLAGCTRPENADYEPLFFSEEEMTVLQEIVDIILPATDTLAASEVGTHRFVDEVIAKCLPAEQQAVIRSGVEGFFPAFREADDRVALIAEVD
ncbi:MAG: gluconate 2-dehydrogenase subunit 3 family protein, partial [Lewinella sp.]|nr:gluconate 2-dehydrogenase subunit 3 family protein [Lewinella sp.]